MASIHSWERKTSIPLAALAVVYLAIYSFEVLIDAHGATKSTLESISNIIWAIFWADYAIRFALAPKKFAFLRANLLEMASLVLPAIRAFRMLRVLTAFNQISQFATSKAARVNLFLFASLPLIFFMCALGILDVERHASGSTIQSFGDAVWWSLTTIATVGYGDLYPVTISGRLIAAVLLFTGIGSMSLITANVASWLSRNLGVRNHVHEAQHSDQSDS